MREVILIHSRVKLGSPRTLRYNEFMIVIFGLGPKHKVEARGQFVCPKCSIKTEYNVKSSRQYFRLFFIPIFPTGKKNEIVECQTCKSTCNTDVLENNNYYLDGSPFKKNN